jgi:hypothetical protein
MITTNCEFILNYIYGNESGIEVLIKCFNESQIDVKLQAARFLIDVFNFSQPFQSDLKQEFFTKLLDSKLFPYLMRLVAYQDNFFPEKEEQIEKANEFHEEYGINKLELLKTQIIEIISNCLQILPSNYISH